MAVEVTTFMSILLFVSSAVARKVVVLDDNEWDSITVTSPPVKITNSRFNTNNTKPNTSNKQPKMARECPEDDLKCFYDSQLTESAGSQNPHDTIQKFMERFSSVTNVKINEDLKNASSKAYWNQITSDKHNNQHFDEKKGWVSLEPIPWSTSKVSRWKPNVSPVQGFGYGPPPSSQLWVTNGLQSPHDGRPSNGHWEMGTNDLITDHRPSEFPNYQPVLPNYSSQSYQPSPHSSFQSSSYHQSPQPSFPPSNFISPPGPQYSQVPPPPTYNYPPQNNYPVPPPKPAFVYGNNYQSTTHNTFQGAEPSKYPSVVGHPPSYPSEGNGEWVLLSTTKGYSIPQRYQERKFYVHDSLNGVSDSQPNIVTRNLRSKYEENVVTDEESKPEHQEVNRKSGQLFEDEPVWTVDGIDILKTGKSSVREQKSTWEEEQDASSSSQFHRHEESPPPEISFKRTVRLTVLPPIGNTSTTAHDGLLEVDSSTQTVEEEQREEERMKKLQEELKEEERMKKLQQLAIVSTGRQPYRIVPLNVQNGRSQDLNRRRAAVLAAVGAGMIPATMAVLLPVALGRRRRSISTADSIQSTGLNNTLLNNYQQ